MQVAILSPANQLQYSKLSKYHLTLLHLYGIPEYRDFYLDRAKEGDHIILDNGANEGVEVDDGHLEDAAYRYNVTEVVAPDQPRDGEISTERTLTFIAQRKVRLNRMGIKVMAIPQGTSKRHWLRNLQMLAGSVDSLGISKMVESFSPRVELAYFANQFGLPIHLMGADARYSDIAWYAHLENVRGVDTQKMYAAGIDGIEFSHDTNKSMFHSIDLGVDRPFKMPPDLDLVIQGNIRQYRKWAGDVSVEA